MDNSAADTYLKLLDIIKRTYYSKQSALPPGNVAETDADTSELASFVATSLNDAELLMLAKHGGVA